VCVCVSVCLCVCVMLDVTEDNSKLQAVVSLISAGPVGISDRINYTDLDLVHRSFPHSLVPALCN